MAAGAGFYNDLGIWQYGETDSIALFSDTLNKGMDSVSDVVGLVKATVIDLEGQIGGIETAIADTGWSTLILTGWTVASTVQFRRIGRVVHCRGEIHGGTTGTTVVATLSSQFRPPVRSAFPLLDLGAGTSDGRMNIDTNGAITIYGGNGGATSPGLSLAGVSYCLA